VGYGPGLGGSPPARPALKKGTHRFGPVGTAAGGQPSQGQGPPELTAFLYRQNGGEPAGPRLASGSGTPERFPPGPSLAPRPRPNRALYGGPGALRGPPSRPWGPPGLAPPLAWGRFLMAGGGNPGQANGPGGPGVSSTPQTCGRPGRLRVFFGPAGRSGGPPGGKRQASALGPTGPCPRPPKQGDRGGPPFRACCNPGAVNFTREGYRGGTPWGQKREGGCFSPGPSWRWEP